MMIAGCTIVTCWERASTSLSNHLIESSDQIKNGQALIAAMKYSDLENKTLREGWIDGWIIFYLF